MNFVSRNMLRQTGWAGKMNLIASCCMHCAQHRVNYSSCHRPHYQIVYIHMETWDDEGNVVEMTQSIEPYLFTMVSVRYWNWLQVSSKIYLRTAIQSTIGWLLFNIQRRHFPRHEMNDDVVDDCTSNDSDFSHYSRTKPTDCLRSVVGVSRFKTQSNAEQYWRAASLIIVDNCIRVVDGDDKLKQ